MTAFPRPRRAPQRWRSSRGLSSGPSGANRKALETAGDGCRNALDHRGKPVDHLPKLGVAAGKGGREQYLVAGVAVLRRMRRRPQKDELERRVVDERRR